MSVVMNDNPALWVNTPSCQLCPTVFGLWQRPHHCRRCGLCVCQSCSPFLETIKQNNPPVRICVKCKRAVDFTFNDFLKGLGLTSRSITAFEDKKQVDFDKFLRLSKKDFDQYKMTNKVPNFIWNAVKREQLKEIPFYVLPPEMLCNILKYLSPRELYHMSLTSKLMTVFINKNKQRISARKLLPPPVNTGDSKRSLTSELIKRPDLLWKSTVFDFIVRYPINQRTKVSDQMLREFVDKIPVIVQLDKPGYQLKKVKYLVPADAGLGRLLEDVKKQMVLNKKENVEQIGEIQLQGISGGERLQNKDLVLALFREYRHEDGLLYVLVV